MYSNPTPAELAQLAALAKVGQPDEPAPSCLYLFFDPACRGSRSLAMVPPDATTQTMSQSMSNIIPPELDYLQRLFKERRALEDRILKQIEHLLAHMPPHNASAISPS